jgi:hypothetical protein
LPSLDFIPHVFILWAFLESPDDKVICQQWWALFLGFLHDVQSEFTNDIIYIGVEWVVGGAYDVATSGNHGR